jgi:hypothetical protein
MTINSPKGKIEQTKNDNDDPMNEANKLRRKREVNDEIIKKQNEK